MTNLRVCALHLTRLMCAAAIATAPALAAPSAVTANELQEMLNLVWEFYWQENGYPQYASKWQEPIRVKFSGASINDYRPFALAQLRRIAGVAGIAVAEVDDTAPANFEVEFVRDNPISRLEPCRTSRMPSTGVIRHVKITAGERALRRCFLHESMHAMGLSGHPRAKSILSYYRNSEELTATDEFVLKVLYSDEITPGMFPLPVLKIFARRLVEAVPLEARPQAQQVAAQFLRETVEQLESFALGTGEPPRIILRSSRATAAGLKRGRIETQFLVGMAYTFGHGVEIDQNKGFAMLARAAALAHREAQLYLGHAYRSGRGVAVDPVEAYKWYALAAEKGMGRAKTEAQQLEQRLSAEQIAEAKARVAAWKPITQETPTAHTDR